MFMPSTWTRATHGLSLDEHRLFVEQYTTWREYLIGCFGDDTDSFIVSIVDDDKPIFPLNKWLNGKTPVAVAVRSVMEKNLPCDKYMDFYPNPDNPHCAYMKVKRYIN